MKRQILMLVVGLGIAAQLAVPAWMIARQEWILRNGTRVYFDTALRDPLDAFRGRYVAIGLAEFGTQNVRDFPSGKMLCALLATNDAGVARITRINTEPPKDGSLFVNVKKEYVSRISNPFNRFYMPEKLAPVAEEIYNESVRGRGATNSVVLLAVRLHKGRGVVEDLLVDGVPMIEAARARAK